MSHQPKDDHFQSNRAAIEGRPDREPDMSASDAFELAAQAADRVAELWRKQAKEWESPKHDLDAEFVKRAAKHKADAADECASAIRKLGS